MSNSLNEVKLIGNLTKDPEVKQTPSGKVVAQFSIATSMQWKDASGEKQEKSEFHNCVAWGKLAEIIDEYCSKGQKLYVCGRLETRSWEDDNGVKKYKTEIVVDEMIMLSKKSEGSSSRADDFDAPRAAAAPKKKDKSSDEEISIEDIPF